MAEHIGVVGANAEPEALGVRHRSLLDDPSERPVTDEIGLSSGLGVLDAARPRDEVLDRQRSETAPSLQTPRSGDAAEPVPNTPLRKAINTWSFIRDALFCLDAVVLLAAQVLLHRVQQGEWRISRDDILFLETGWLLLLVGLRVGRAYDRSALQRPVAAANALVTALAWATVLVLVFAVLGRLFSNVSPDWVLAAWALSAGVLGATHFGAIALVRRLIRSGRLRERVAVVGAGKRARQALAKLQEADSFEVTVIGLFDDRRTRVSDGHDRRGDTDELLEIVRRHGIDRVILALPWTAEERIISIVSKLRQAPVRIDLTPHESVWRFSADVTRFHGVPIITVANHRVDRQLGWAKRAEDLVLGSLMLVCLTPVLLAVAVAIRCDTPGPILYRQKRFGFNNEIFEVYKFRSMLHEPVFETEVKQATRNDPRVTRVGRFIRRTSLDELPQLLNVLFGTMSIVGPRPHAVSHNLMYAPLVVDYFARHNVKPGITGWAQVKGYRGEIDALDKMERRVALDLVYIDKWSIVFDLRIMFLTALRVWFHNAAY
jgi:Undecaprenyl-phosphate glucose phosphotransferase